MATNPSPSRTLDGPSATKPLLEQFHTDGLVCATATKMQNQMSMDAMHRRRFVGQLASPTSEKNESRTSTPCKVKRSAAPTSLPPTSNSTRQRAPHPDLMRRPLHRPISSGVCERAFFSLFFLLHRVRMSTQICGGQWTVISSSEFVRRHTGRKNGFCPDGGSCWAAKKDSE